MGLILKVLGGYVLFYITRAIYYLYFHPLSKYPGPKSWIVSRIPYLICMNSGNLPFKIKQLHDEYGPVVRLASDELSINDARAWRDIYTRKDMLRPPQWGARPPGVEAHNIISANAADHARFRKALASGFSDRSVNKYESVIRTYFDKLTAHLDNSIAKSGKGAVVDLVEWVNFATFDIIGEVTWSKGYNCVDTGTGHVFMSILLHFQAALIGATIKYYPWLDVFMEKITPKSAFQLLTNVFEDGHQRLQDRMNADTPHADIFGSIKEHNEKVDSHEKLSDAEIEQNLLAVIIGGSETLTTTFSGVFHYLLADPPKLNRLVKEIRSSFASESEITGSAASKLPYLNAVIDETFRMCPPLPDALRRQVPSSGAGIAGMQLPPQTTVSVSCYSMFHSTDHFENPEEFEPERFMQGKDYPAFHPFALGPHNCPGQSLAKLEMRLLLTLLLYKFDFQVPAGQSLKRWTDQKIYWTWEKHPLPLAISPAGSQ